MPLITWKENFNVNVGEIDQQHQGLVNMLNDLFDAMQRGEGKKVLGETIDGLLDYAALHFQTEEKYFDKFGYPDAVSHKQEHADFVEKVMDFRAGFDQGKIFMTTEVMTFLSDWLQTHIAGSDKQYSQFFNDNGLK